MSISVAPVFGLVDCNNFYVSCERVFNARLHNKPVVVLSNNDGCVIARSEEAKQLGVTMGMPLFKAQHLVDEHSIEVLSSNYTLYGDMSNRVMTTLREFTPDVEVYSIDEAFVNLEGIKEKHFAEVGGRIREQVRRWTGIPVSVGIAGTKTLAKLANRAAKRADKTQGVIDIMASQVRKQVLEQTPVEDVWGIGRQYAKLLKNRGVENALQFARMDRRWVRHAMTVVGARVHAELNGVSCLPLEAAPRARKSLTCSRSFGADVTTLEGVKEAVAVFTTKIAERLRGEKLAANVVTVFIETSRSNVEDERYANAATRELLYPTDSTEELLNVTAHATESLFRAGFRYKKAGVMLNALKPSNQLTVRMFHQDSWERSRRVSQAMDKLNKRFGRHTIRYGSVEPEGSWQMKAARRSQRYTTNLNELLIVDVDKQIVH